MEDEGGELAMIAAGSGDADTIFDPFTPRLVLAISTGGELLPNASVTLTISGEAREVIDSGEVVVMLPTKAAMDHAGAGRQPYYPLGETLPTEASWQLPTMAAGDTWERTVTVPGAAAGYYMVAATADTYGPESDLGPFLFNGSYTQAWMFVSATDGQLTSVFEDSLFPEGVRPVPGPFTTEAELLARAPSGHKSLYLEVAYWDVRARTWGPAVGADIWGQYVTADGEPVGPRLHRTVPEDGVVRFACPSENQPYMRGEAELPETRYINGRDDFIGFWSAHRSDCSSHLPLKSVFGPGYEYMPWRNLSDVIPIVNDSFGYSRSRIRWEVDPNGDDTYYRRGNLFLSEKIQFGRDAYHSAWVAAHEYTHALHHKAMGGMWDTENCNPHYVRGPSSYTCAFSEGLADYGGTVGASGLDRFGYDDWETYNSFDYWEDFSSDSIPKPKIEGYVAALFHDLIDGGTGDPDIPNETDEPEDKTQYSTHYVMKVFATCEVKVRLGKGNGNVVWRKRNDVSDFVWCLENRVDTSEHRRIFPGIETPIAVREWAAEPSDWNPDSIRSTWLWNLDTP